MNAREMADDLEDRLIRFAVRIIRLVDALPKTPSGRHVSHQLLRAGTSGAPNYGEARGAESHDDFLHKMKIVQKELNESMIWLKIVDQSDMMKSGKLQDLKDECRQLCRIFAKAVSTAKQRRRVASTMRTRLENGEVDD